MRSGAVKYFVYNPYAKWRDEARLLWMPAADDRTRVFSQSIDGI